MSPTVIQIILLGIVQGAAELLPVSSSAHVIAAEKLMGLPPSSPEMTFLLAMLHTGTMGAVIVYFWKSWKVSFFSSAATFRAAAVPVVLATIATGVVYLVLDKAAKHFLLKAHPGASVEDLFSNLPLMAASLTVAGILIVVSGLRSPPAASVPAGSGALPLPKATWIGVAQGVCLPFRGLSRSGATISTGMLLAVPKRAAEEFSFALAVVLTPAVIGREFLRLYKDRAAAGALHLAPMMTPGLIGMVASFFAGLLALKWLSGWLEHGRWHYFGFYCFAAAAGIAFLASRGY
jgi:undecaprenyl-diphosphatase